MLHLLIRSITAIRAISLTCCLAFIPAVVSGDGVMDQSDNAGQSGHPDPNVVLPDALLQAVIVKPDDIDAQLRPAPLGMSIGAGCEARLADDLQPPPQK